MLDDAIKSGLPELEDHPDRFIMMTVPFGQRRSERFEPVGEACRVDNRVLHELLRRIIDKPETIDRNGGSGMTAAERQQVGAAIVDAAEATTRGRLFELGNVDTLDDITNTGALTAEVMEHLRLPFEVTPVVVGITGTPSLFVLRGDEAGVLQQVTIVVLRRLGDGRKALVTMAVLEYARTPDGTLAIIAPEGVDKDTAWLLTLLGNASRTLLSWIDDDRVPAKRIIADAALNRARARRGKPGLVDYWKIDVKVASGLYQTTLGAPRPETGSPRARGGIGHHKSPIPHDRRGHRRRLRSGKIAWIRPTRINELLKHLTRKRDFYAVEVKGDRS